MDRQRDSWRARADELWRAPRFSHPDAARLLADIVRETYNPALRDLARQALPGLRQAADAKGDAFRRETARRRFGLVREKLWEMARPSFGHRRGFQAGTALVGPGPGVDLEYRRLLGLPGDGALREPEIMAAYRQAAKASHPDCGGSAETFIRLVAARDALLARM